MGKVRPKGKHDDQVDSTAQFLDWFKRPFWGQAFSSCGECKRRARQSRKTRYTFGYVCEPLHVGSVQTFSGRHINLSPDRTVEMSAEDAEYLIRAGWAKLAEWPSSDHA